MIKVSIMYPASAGATFDMAYYCDKHLPLVQQKMGAALKKYGADLGLAGGAPGAPPAYIAFGYLYCESVEAFQAAFAPHAAEILADVPNYTNTQPQLQISEIKL